MGTRRYITGLLWVQGDTSQSDIGHTCRYLHTGGECSGMSTVGLVIDQGGVGHSTGGVISSPLRCRGDRVQGVRLEDHFPRINIP